MVLVHIHASLARIPLLQKDSTLREYPRKTARLGCTMVDKRPILSQDTLWMPKTAPDNRGTHPHPGGQLH